MGDKEIKNFSSKQIKSFIKLCKNLQKKYSIKKENFLGHADIAKLLLESGARLCAAAHTGDTALHMAVQNKRLNIVMLLLAHNAHVDVLDCESNAPLFECAWHDCVEIAQYLIQNGACVLAENNHGQTPLHYAVERDHLGMAALLTRHGALIDVCDKNGRSPLAIAEQTGQSDMVALLQKSTVAPVSLKP